jgi:hypothetical protein
MAFRLRFSRRSSHLMISSSRAEALGKAHDHALPIRDFTEMCGPQTTTAGSVQGIVTAQLQWN